MNQKHIFCNCLYFNSNAFARKMNQLAEDAFLKTGLSPSHAFVLMSVIRENGISIGDVSKTMFLKPSSVTRLVEKLELKGLLTRRNDGRNSFLYASESGKEMQAELEQSWSQIFQEYNRLLGEDFAGDLSNRIFSAIEKL